MRDVRQFIESFTAEYEPLRAAAALGGWRASARGRSEDYARLRRLQMRVNEFLADRARYEALARFYERLEEISDPLLRRQVERAYKLCKPRQGPPELMAKLIDVSTRIGQKFNTFRAQLNDRRFSSNQLAQILRSTRDSRRAQEVWSAAKSVGELVAEDIREAVRIRNRIARQLGYQSAYQMGLELMDLSEPYVFSILQELESLSEQPYRRVLGRIQQSLAEQFGVAVEQLRPWHYRNMFFQAPPVPEAEERLGEYFRRYDPVKVAVDFYDGLGLDVRGILARSDLYERPGKAQNALCIGIRPPEDVRILCNLMPDGSSMRTLLHELGHALYSKNVDPSLPALLRGASHLISTESVAFMMEQAVMMPEFLRDYLHVPSDEADRIGTVLQQRHHSSVLVFLRWVLVMCHFERDLYADPDAELNDRWWRYVQRFQLLHPPEGRDKPDWASKVHIALSPVYYQNYQLGHLHNAQTMDWLRRSVVDGRSWIGDRAVGEAMRRQVFAPGARLKFNEHLQSYTGSPLKCDFFAKQYLS